MPIIEDVSFYLDQNEFVTLIGPSGCGKSTIFNMIAGIVPVEEGKVFIDGRDCTGEVGQVSYMYQKDLLLPWKKVIDNTILPLIIKGESVREARKKVIPYLKLFGLEGFEYKYPFQLSGGMRQRAALLRTYMFSKDILLLDEPFGGLDAITRSKMQSWLLEVIEKVKASVLFVTHDIEEAIYLSDRIYVLTERPARIKEEVPIHLPRPREREIVTTTQFNRIKRHILLNLS
ncbi:MAG: ABC transporter ATP-binding protein [Candidatus Atribacteria bacterium]|nr:ABC transporter ATP-binding protein [Candidatus Atribacteria bacterium]